MATAMALRSLALKYPVPAALSPLFSASSCSVATRPLPSLSLPRLRPVLALADHLRAVPLAVTRSRGAGQRCFSSSRTASSLNDPSPNWSNRPPKETILLDGCDFEHWLVVVEPPDPNLTRDEIIQSYIKTLAQVVGSEEEARFKIYSVSTKHYFAFGALVSEELSYKIKALPGVRWVLPDSYLDVKNKDYGGEPFINGEAVPYDPKYHEEWVRNNARSKERNRRNDRPRNFDRTRNFDRRRENMQSFQNRTPMQNQEFGNQSGPSPPVPSGTMPGQSSMPLMPDRSAQNAMPSGNAPNLRGPSHGGHANHMPGQNPVPPPVPGQNTQPVMPRSNASNVGRPNQAYGGYQNQVLNHQNGPQNNQSYPGCAAGSNTYPPGGNGYYQGLPSSYQGPPNTNQGGAVGFQATPPNYHGNTGTYQGNLNSYQGGASSSGNYSGGAGNTCTESGSPYHGRDGY